MAAQTISITNLSGGVLSLDIKLSEDRAIRDRLAIGASVDVTNVASLEELDQNAEMQALVASGNAKLVLTDGPTRWLTATLTSGGSADTLVESPTAYDYKVLDCFARVSTTEAAATCTLRDALAGGGNALSTALDLNTAHPEDASTAAASTVLAGGLITANRNTLTNAAEVWVLVQRLS